MQKKFLSSLGLLLLLNLLVKPLYILGIDAEVQNRVGQEAYGTYFALLNLSFLFNILIDLGINNFNNRNIAQNQQLIGKHFSKLFSAKALLAIIYAGITLVLGLVLGYHGVDFWILLVLVFNQVIVSFILFARSNLAALHLFTRDSAVSVLDRGLLIIFCSILLFTNITGEAFSILWFVYLQTLSYVITLIVALSLIWKRAGRLRWNLEKAFSILIFKKSIPYALFILAGMLYTRIDGIMIENILADGSTQAGHYAQGYRFYEAAGMFALLFGTLLLPTYSRMLKDKENVLKIVQISARILMGLGAFAAIFTFYHGDWLLNWRYIDVDEQSVNSFTALMIGFFGVCMFYVYGTLMTANENLKELNFIAFGGLLINVVLNFILIPEFLAFGAAITTMVTQFFAGLAQLIFVVIHFRLGMNYKMIAQFFIFFVAYIGMNLVLVSYLDSDLYAALFSVISGLLLLMVSKVLSIRQIKVLLKPEK